MRLQMVKKWLRALTTAALMAVTFVTPLWADDEPAKKATELPIKKVVLFNSGVGFFEHQGKVTGDTNVQLKFNVGEINDLLKSMVLQDLDGGQVSTVTYGSKDPITKTLKTFAIDLTADPSLAALLRQVRGAKIELDGTSTVVGVIVSVETRRLKVGDSEFIDQEFVNLLTEDGLRSVSLASVGRIRFLDKELDAEFRKALMVLAQSHDTDKKTVGLEFLGQGERNVRVGYVQESPVWKTSYRLVLDDKNEPFLQGWAIVENTTDNDWKDVRLTLISGRPISYVMDLYQPLYVRRPHVQLDLYASLLPKTYDQSLLDKDHEFARVANERRKYADAPASPAPADPAEDAFSGAGAGSGPGRGESNSGGYYKSVEQSVHSVATAGDVGDLFEYKIENPVSLARQRSAMLPIVNSAIEGEKLAIYNEATHARHPLNGLRMVNTTGLHLMQGPITVFDGGVYAGDAKIADIADGSERLISYALDVNTEVAYETKGSPEQMVSVKIVRGNLMTERKHFRSRYYTVKNSNDAAKTVLIEYPVQPQWTLVDPKEANEKTRDLYRFAVNAKPGEVAKLTLREERVAYQTIALNNQNDDNISFYLRTKVVSDDIKKALGEISKRKKDIAEVQTERGEKQRQIQTIEADQNRIRQNMARVPRESDLYRRYVEKFTKQEDTIEDLREAIGELSEKEHELQRNLNAYLTELTLS